MVWVEEAMFESGGVRCAGTFYRPAEAGQQEPTVPCVVMGPGLGGTREFGLARYARAFAAHGFAAFTFDYRHFGNSDGDPRQLVHSRRQQEDYRAAVAYARGIAGVDPQKVALWGTSLSAGHVLVLAAAGASIAAVIIQAPGLSARPRLLWRIVRAIVCDGGAALLGRPPHYVPVVGAPGGPALMREPRAVQTMLDLASEGTTPWRNRVALRAMSTGPPPRPATVLQPLVVCIADRDELIPPAAAWRAARLAPRGEVRRYPIGHFDVHLPPAADLLIADQIAFLHHHLDGGSAAASPQHSTAGTDR